jgi:16S rRNA processing protein RimM
MGPTTGSTSSTETERESDERRVALGQVVGAHGLGGQLRVRYFGGAPDNLMKLETALLVDSDDVTDGERFEVNRVAPGRRGEVRMALVGVERREFAEQLRGRLVLAKASQLEALPEGEYYSYEFVGCEVEGADGRPIGTVREVWATGAVDVLVVEDEKGVQQLIPAVESQLREVDIEARRIVIEILPGLLDTA